MTKITTSWDDGDILDKRLADLLSKYGVTGTFYVTKQYRAERVSESDIAHIAEKHEIGAHTITHPDLRSLSPEKIKEELSQSKQWLEEIIHSAVTMFCYPKGLWNDTVARITKEAGFAGARTTELGSIAMPTDPYQMGTTLQVYPFPFRKIDATKYFFGKILEPYVQRAPGLYKLGVSKFHMFSWLSAAKATFDVTKKNNGVFHLWGHSWEIEKYGMWKDLEALLQYITKQTDNEYVTNGELVSMEKII